jgi:hypothetical protein
VDELESLIAEIDRLLKERRCAQHRRSESPVPTPTRRKGDSAEAARAAVEADEHARYREIERRQRAYPHEHPEE